MRESDIIPTTENTQETERVETDDMSITAAGGWTVPSEMVYEDNIPVRDIPDPLARLHQLADGSIRFEHEPEDRDPETQIAHGPRFQWSLPQAFGPDPTDEELASAQERRANAIMAAREALAARNLAGQPSGSAVSRTTGPGTKAKAAGPAPIRRRSTEPSGDHARHADN
jgi:hypothetical protein